MASSNRDPSVKSEGDSELEKLYKYYDILVQAKDKLDQHQGVFEAIIASTKGSTGAKRLGATFIAKFAVKFASLHDVALDAMFDLLEDEDSQVRKTVMKVLPEMCGDHTDFCNKVCDVLSQLLVTEDLTELSMVKSSLVILVRRCPKDSLCGIFSQVLGDDEITREKCIEFICTNVMKYKSELFATNFENEKFFIEQIKEVLKDVTAEEFKQFVDILLQLRTMATRQGAQELVDIVINQADLKADFQANDVDYLYRVITCYQLAVDICKERGGSLAQYIDFVCTKVLPVLPTMDNTKDSAEELLQLLARSVQCGINVEQAKQIVTPIFDALLYYVPLPTTDDETPTLQFSYVECLLYCFHRTAQLCPEFLSGPDVDKLKDFRKRLQYFAHGCQMSHSKLEATLKDKTNTEALKIRKVAHATTGNINSLIKVS